MRKISAILLFLLCSTNALAFRGRPVTDLRFQHQEWQWPSSVASNGDDYLIVTGDRYRLLGQIISRGEPVGPAFLIARASTRYAEAIWTGSNYLVAWGDDAWSDTGLWTATVSRSGTVSLPVPTIPGPQLQPRLARNGGHILVAALSMRTYEMYGVVLDEEGKGIVNSFRLFGSALDFAACATGDGFAIGSFGLGEARVFRLDNNGHPLDANGTLVEKYNGPDWGRTSAAIASDGKDVVVLFVAPGGADRYKPKEIRSAVINARGEVIRAARPLLTRANEIQGLHGLRWTGSDYLAAVALEQPRGGTSPDDAALLRIDRNGGLLDGPFTVAGDLSQIPIVAFGSNGRENLLAFVADDLPAYVRVPAGSTASGEPTTFGREINRQTAVDVAAREGGYLEVWIETIGQERTLRAARIDAEGRFLDGDGIVLERWTERDGLHTVRPAVERDGSSWLIVRGNNVTRLSDDGVVFGREVSGGASSLRCANNFCVSAAETANSVAVSSIGAGGGTASRVIARSSGSGTRGDPLIRYQVPVVTFDGTNFLIVFERSVIVGNSASYYILESGVLGMRVDRHGVQVDAQPFTIAIKGSLPSAASIGSTSLVISSNPMSASMVRTDGAVPVVTHFPLPGASSDITAVAADGDSFVVATSSAMSRVSLTGEISGIASFPQVGEVSLASAPGMTPIFGFMSGIDAYDAEGRAAFAFSSEVAETSIPDVPAALSATRIAADSIAVRWTLVDGALGYSIELRLPDGTFRQIGVAAGASAAATVHLHGLEGTAVRVRAWNITNLSAPSNEVAILPPRRRI